jgi:hypothetical protein
VGDLGEGCNKPGCGNATIARLKTDVRADGRTVHAIYHAVHSSH